VEGGSLWQKVFFLRLKEKERKKKERRRLYKKGRKEKLREKKR